MNNIIYAVVLYNGFYYNSETLTFLTKEMKDNLIIVFDNSDKKEFYSINKHVLSKEKQVVYISNEENVGLSKAYNFILDFIFANINPTNKYICWLDDDTYLALEYFREQNEAVQRGFDIFVPKIIGQDGIIYSPNNAGYLKNKLINTGYDVDNFKKFNAINSCLTVNLKIYSELRYNETLFLDQVDQLFFDQLRKINFTFKVGEYIVLQNFSQRDKELSSNYINRFKIRVKDIIRYGEESPDNNILICYLKNCLLGLMFFKKTLNLKYLVISMLSIWRYKK
ncbi:MAG: glycosyltransferase [Lactococcus sp.]|uniref:glycosyltransferase n=1 Tax=Pseudolactococcus carnosus TaxID=2749961 RepID=UPI001FB96586|nr:MULTISPECIES: glycosyltransferase [Lactococcus]MCJ1974323.1 glycosyltransferase [Lactococcus carnosus]MDN5410031.1 glycosyltransferase [Lactococcus sp.]MDN5464233.1 glycosyltransferase [Lactococcus lactis]